MDFQIGEYKDRVLCDTLPMDCFHLLLARPWKFDRKFMYDGWENTYNIWKDNQIFKLTPQQGKEKDKGKSKVVIFGKKEPLRIGDNK